MSVCLFAIRLKNVRANATKLSRNTLHVQRKVGIHFFSKKNNASLATCTPM